MKTKINRFLFVSSLQVPNVEGHSHTIGDCLQGICICCRLELSLRMKKLFLSKFILLIMFSVQVTLLL